MKLIPSPELQEVFRKMDDEKRKRVAVCPFCGMLPPYTGSSYGGGPPYAVYCPRCGIYGPEAKTISEAESKWNQRTPTP